MIAFIIFLEKFLLKPNKSSRAGVRGVRAPARCDSGSAIALPSTGVCKMGLLLVCFFFFFSSQEGLMWKPMLLAHAAL